MTLDRKDLRLKLDPDVHAGLSLVAQVTDRDMADIAEGLIAEYVRRRIHEATVIADRAARLGLSGNCLEWPGKIGESQG